MLPHLVISHILFIVKCKYLNFFLLLPVNPTQEFPSLTISCTRNSELYMDITTVQQSLATATASSSLPSSSRLSLTPFSSLSTSSLLPSSSSTSLSTSSSLTSLSSSSSLSSPTTTTIIKTSPAKLLETSPTSTVNLGDGFPTPSISSETTYTWCSVKNTTSPFNSIESSTPSPSIESSSVYNHGEKLQHEAIAKVHYC